MADIVVRAREESAYLRDKYGVPLSTPTMLNDCADEILRLRTALAEAREVVGRVLALCEEGGDLFDEPGRPTLNRARAFLTSTKEKADG